MANTDSFTSPLWLLASCHVISTSRPSCSTTRSSCTTPSYCTTPYSCTTLVTLLIILSIPFTTPASLSAPPSGQADDDDVMWRLRHHLDVVKPVVPSGGILINEPHTCDERPFAAIFVHSAPKNSNYRSAIRKSWGSASNEPELHVKVMFIVGVSPNDVTDGDNATWRHIADESATYRDILQFDLVDAYENLSLKSLAMLRWVREFCAGVHYVIKADDDTFLNTRLLIGDLRAVVHERFLMGDIIAGARPIRDRHSKYYTPIGQYNASVYPTYLSGAAYVISGDLIAALTEAASRTELFWLEDVYITGLLGRLVDAKLIFNGKFAFRTQDLGRCQLSRIIALHRINPEEMVNAWKLVNEENTKCKHRS